MQKALTLPALLLGVCAAVPGAAAGAGEQAKWTVMVFMNADNNLDGDAVTNFKQIASVGKDPRVNVVVQLDRSHKTGETAESWSRTLRFEIGPRMTRQPPHHRANRIQDCGELNMGDGQVLGDFVEWGLSNYPAEHYMLIIWNHGQGWRAAGDTRRDRPVRSVSNDDSQGDCLYNQEVHDTLVASLRKVFPDRHRKLDVIGFDACLMAMVETAYAMRDVADYMVASQEIEPGEGWDYRGWLGGLVAIPSMQSPSLCEQIVRTYGASLHQRYANTSLSAVCLSWVDQLATAVSEFSRYAMGHLAESRSDIRRARAACLPMGSVWDSAYATKGVDIDRFFGEFLNEGAPPGLETRAQGVIDALAQTILESYSGSDLILEDEAGRAEGGGGLAIYFPESASDYLSDPDSRAYRSDEESVLFPIQFVRDHAWDNFLHAYWQ